MTGEVAHFSDSDNVLQVIHSGGTDGLYHTWSTSHKICFPTNSSISQPTVVTENLDDISPSNQNKTFDDFESDFLDFSESNPFGDIYRNVWYLFLSQKSSKCSKCLWFFI